jgi:hypothetical protein
MEAPLLTAKRNYRVIFCEIDKELNDQLRIMIDRVAQDMGSRK